MFIRQRVNRLLFIIIVSVSSCVTVVEKAPAVKSEREKAQDDLDLAGQALKDEEGKYKHIKRLNPEPLIKVIRFHLKKKKEITYLTVKLKNNTKVAIRYYEIKWRFFDKAGNEVIVNKEQWGSSALTDIAPGHTDTNTWTFEPAPLVQTVQFGLKTVQFQNYTTWDYTN